ncbi:MAG: TlpA disulfide reductase family protein [Candidatus Omnitrophica bacterium]|nr:TlpA disulfide reductase family protein [Candidatus Omnitrophota bacterium]MDD5077692.1 TlpA disulfide reductase family protein [Candidatus Omnitrophota bacterium]MDD5724748.1 TlpA disulfide reductase family protein [Candidatus Omnitrophota bacterium]
MRNFRMPFLAVLFFIFSVFGSMSFAEGIVLSDLKGEKADLASYKGKPVILFFWTTWCPYCRQELKDLNQRYPQITEDGIVLLGVNVNEPSYKVQNFFESYPLQFRMLLDKNGLLADEYNLMGVPTYVFLDKEGKEISQAHSLPPDYKLLLSGRKGIDG